MSETRALASYVVNGRWDDIPIDVQHEARRALVNYLGCALGGARDEAVELALRALAPFSGPPTAVVLGRDERLDPLHASLMNGISSHVYDYDDTTPKNYSHPSSPVASALFAYASANRVSGRQFIEAFVFGFEAESRVANAVYPAHYDAGWHITGTSGVFGAAAAIGKLLGLGEQQMVWALGLAATQAAGLREMFGSMAKSFHPGRSAQNGYAAALLAQAGFTAGERAIEGPARVRGGDGGAIRSLEGHRSASAWTSTCAPTPTSRFRAASSTTRPSTRASSCTRRTASRRPRSPRCSCGWRRWCWISCNQTGITKGLQGKFSVYHGAAVGLVRGKAGIQEYTDAAVNDPAVKRVRELTRAAGDAAITEDQAHVAVETVDGRRVEAFVEESLGNLRRPLSDAQLEAKFRDQAAVNLPAGVVDALIEQCWQIDRLDDVGALVEASRAQPVR